METDREIIKKIILTHSRNSGDYLPDYKYEDVITDILAQFGRKSELPINLTEQYVKVTQTGINEVNKALGLK
ncbi:MAG: hypothetical protein PHS93_09525 [Candidatus Omnitrophica bacterium]|nr:hypothetical protein [Candidatus Omnitrophota bacterium]